MILEIEGYDYDLFKTLINDIDIMIPPYRLTKPHIYEIDWRNLIVKMFADGEWYNTFIAWLKPYIIKGKFKVRMNLKEYQLAIYNKDIIPDPDWLIMV